MMYFSYFQCLLCKGMGAVLKWLVVQIQWRCRMLTAFFVGLHVGFSVHTVEQLNCSDLWPAFQCNPVCPSLPSCSATYLMV